MVLLKDIDAHFSEILSKFGIEKPMHQDFYLKKIKPLVYNKIRKGLALINFISEESCDDFFKNFKSEHQKLFKEAYELIQPLLERMQQSTPNQEIESQITIHINSYLAKVKNSLETLSKSQILSCAQSLSNGLELFDKKSQDERWQKLSSALKKQLKMYSAQFKKLKNNLTELLTKDISQEPFLSEFKTIYEQALNLMYSCRQEITDARNNTTDSTEKPLLEQLRIIVQMIWKRLCSLFSDKAIELFADKEHSRHEFMGFSQSHSSSCQTPQNNLKH